MRDLRLTLNTYLMFMDSIPVNISVILTDIVDVEYLYWSPKEMAGYIIFNSGSEGEFTAKSVTWGKNHIMFGAMRFEACERTLLVSEELRHISDTLCEDDHIFAIGITDHHGTLRLYDGHGDHYIGYHGINALTGEGVVDVLSFDEMSDAVEASKLLKYQVSICTNAEHFPI